MSKQRIDRKLQKRRERRVALLVAEGKVAEAAQLAQEWGIQAGGEGVAQIAGGVKLDSSARVIENPQKEAVTEAWSKMPAEIYEAFTKQNDDVFASVTKSPEKPESASEAEVPEPAPKPAFSAQSGEVAPRAARIYAVPRNPLIRLIEFCDDGSHGSLRVGFRDGPMLNWRVWVVPDGGRFYKLHGRYNSRGLRVR